MQKNKQPFAYDAMVRHTAVLVSSRNAPPWCGGALRDDTENGCVAPNALFAWP